MNCEQCQEQLAAFALGALEPAEEAEVRAHLAEKEHRGCVEALERALATVDVLPVALAPVQPRAQVWKAIERTVDTRPRRVILPWVVAAAAVLALGVSVWRNRGVEERLQVAQRAGVLESQRCDRDAAQLTAIRGSLAECSEARNAAERKLDLSLTAVALANQPGSRVLAFTAPQASSARATAVVNMKDKKVMIMARGVEPPAGKDFELWVIRGNEKMAAGILRASGDTMVMHAVDEKLLAGGMDALAVTLEVEGGVTAPAGPIVLLAALTP